MTLDMGQDPIIEIDERFLAVSEALNEAKVPTTDRYVAFPQVDGSVDVEGPITL